MTTTTTTPAPTTTTTTTEAPEPISEAILVRLDDQQLNELARRVALEVSRVTFTIRGTYP